MHTIYDWATLMLFCGIAVLFLSRSVGPRVQGDSAVKYIPAAIGCAAADQLGNLGRHALAVALLIATSVYLLIVLKPWPRQR